jgi:antitoxin HicB
VKGTPEKELQGGVPQCCHAGGFKISCPALPGCHSQGDTEEEAIENIKDAIRRYLEVLNERALQRDASEKILESPRFSSPAVKCTEIWAPAQKSVQSKNGFAFGPRLINKGFGVRKYPRRFS